MRVWKEVFAELGKDFDVKDLRNLTEEIEKASNGNYAGKNGNEKKAQPYAPIWVYRKRLDQVLSIMGYRVNVTNPCIQHAQKRNIDILTVQVSLQLLEDDFKTIAFEVQKPGLAEVTNASSLQMNLGKATSAGLKDCCDEFRIGGNIELIWRRAHSASSAGQKNTYWKQQSASRPSAPIQIFKVVRTGSLEEEDGTYHIPVKTSDGKEVELWFYDNRYKPLLSVESKYGCKNRLEDLFKVWATATGKHVLTLKGQLNEETKRLNFRELVDSEY
ncbi:MAG: hypothetical protein KH357_10540 [Clostridiales bacterium]|nr:hypothetical protein [Clostridiales bacterium]